jgi:cytidylate kinase
MPARTIAIDGPAASGKSTVAQVVARRLGYLFFDTGVMYRAVTLEALRRRVSPEDEAGVVAVAEGLTIDVRPASRDDGRSYDVVVDGQDATWAIRSPEVDRNVSRVSAYPGVRKAMTRRQREIGMRGRVVMVGRDIGTVVLPEADLKVYLVAGVEERARRRHRELLLRGEAADYDEILHAMAARDAYDSSRELAPLKPAAEAVVVDTTTMEVGQVVDRVLELAEA